MFQFLFSLFRGSWCHRRKSLEGESGSEASFVSAVEEEESLQRGGLQDWETEAFEAHRRKEVREAEERERNFGYTDSEVSEIERHYWEEIHVPTGDEDDYSETFFY